MSQHGVIILNYISMVRIKIFFTFKNKLTKMLLSGLVGISVVAAMLPIAVRPNAILKSEFENI